MSDFFMHIILVDFVWWKQKNGSKCNIEV